MKKIGLWTQVYTFIPPKSVHFYTAVDTLLAAYSLTSVAWWDLKLSITTINRFPGFALPNSFNTSRIPSCLECSRKVTRKVPLTTRIPTMLTPSFMVFFTSGVRANDHMRRVLAVVCGEHSSKKSSTAFLLIRWSFFESRFCIRRSAVIPRIGFSRSRLSFYIICLNPGSLPDHSFSMVRYFLPVTHFSLVSIRMDPPHILHVLCHV